MIETPLDVISELARIRAESERGIGYLAEVEQRLVVAELAADRAEAFALLEAEGTIAIREAIAKIKSEPEREAAALAKVEVNRVKLKLKHLTESMMAVQTSARMIEIQWKTAGVGER